MGYIKFNKDQLVNLSNSLNIESLRVNANGSFTSSTIVNCNTRKYHGLLVSAQKKIDGGYHVLLSSLDETIIQKDKEFHLAVHKYPGVLHSGHKYLTGYSEDPLPTFYYRVGGVELKKEMLLAGDEDKIYIRYTVLKMEEPATMRLHPFLAYRNIHSLSKANFDAQTYYREEKNGISARMYGPYPRLYMQLSRKNEFVSAPDWFYNVEYEKELERGYEAHEDLFVPGFFELKLKKDQSVVFAAGITGSAPNQLSRKFQAEMKKCMPRDNFEQCMDAAAEQFIVKGKNTTEIVASYPWVIKNPRDTFIALPGLTLARKQYREAEQVLDAMTASLKGAFFNQSNDYFIAEESSVDASLWYFWSIQQYAAETDGYKKVEKSYWKAMKQILELYREGTDHDIAMDDEGLLRAGDGNVPLTWMNARANGDPVTPRCGYPVEVNALWYNAVCFALEVAEKAKDQIFINYWKDIPKRIEDAFVKHFWDEDKGFLADVYNGERSYFAVRPNQVLAASMPYSPVNKQIKQSLMKVVEEELLTPQGLRTLSPRNGRYTGVYVGNVYDRAVASHQGSAWPWLFAHFAEAYLKIYGKRGRARINKLYHEFDLEMTKNGIGTLSELYDGNPPYHGRGAISHAINLAELVRTRHLLQQYYV